MFWVLMQSKQKTYKFIFYFYHIFVFSTECHYTIFKTENFIKWKFNYLTMSSVFGSSHSIIMIMSSTLRCAGVVFSEADIFRHK